MDEDQLKNYLVSIVESGLKDNCQPEQQALITQKIVATPSDIDSLKKAIGKVRMAIRLLIDEDLADDLYEEMMSILAGGD